MSLPRLLAGIKYDCEYYNKCHKDLEDCTFCYCPFYPCGDAELGKLIDGDIWDCSDCTVIHTSLVVEGIFDHLNEEYRWSLLKGKEKE